MLTGAVNVKIITPNDDTAMDDVNDAVRVVQVAAPTGSTTVDTELPAAVALADNTANPTVPGVAAFLMGFDGVTWDRVGSGGGAIPVTDNAGSLTVDGTVSVSGTVTVDSELPAAAALADNTANPTVPGVGAFGMLWDGATWDRAAGTSADGALVNLGANNDVTVTGTVTIDSELPAAAALADNTANPTVPGVGAFGLVWDGATWDRAPGTSADGTLVNLGANNDVTVTGTVTVDTEMPAAAALADNASNPTAPAVGAFGMVWDGATWDRQPGTSADGALVNLGVNNDVTVTGTVTVDSELPAAATLADNTANPSVPGVGSFNLVWDGATWDRAPGTSADGTLVNLGANNDVTVTSGTVTANQGTAAAGSGVWPVAVTTTTDTIVKAGDSANNAVRVNVVAGSSGGVTHTDDATFTVAVDDGVPAFAMFDDVSPDSVNENDAGIVRMSANRNLYTTIRDAAGNERGINVSANNAGAVAGDAAHDASDVGNPVKIGAFAETSPAGRALVADGDRTTLIASADGILIIRPYCSWEDIVSGVDTDTAGDSTAVIAAQGSGIRTYITTIVSSNTSNTNITIDIRDGAAGAVLATIPVPKNGGATVNFPVPLRFSANTAVAIDPSAAVTTTVTTAVGFKAAI